MPADAKAELDLASLFRHAQFAVLDLVRHAQGQALGAIGYDPDERPYEGPTSGAYWRLRDYGAASADASLLIVAAPIKRPYIWDLAPDVSAVGYCVSHGLRVHLLEWIPPAPASAPVGLDECAKAISECVARIAAGSNGTKPFLIGHSLGGTLAAIFAAGEPHSLRGLLLLGAPLCFQPATSRFRDALVAIVPTGLPETVIVPGSLLSHASALASPDTFVWSRMADAAASMNDRKALEIHARFERWALDETPLPGRLVHQMVEWLYRENRFCRGELVVQGRTIGPSSLDVPTLAVVNTADEVAPIASVEPLLEALPTDDVSLIRYDGEIGVALQHVGILVGREAYAKVWPDILAWLAAHR